MKGNLMGNRCFLSHISYLFEALQSAPMVFFSLFYFRLIYTILYIGFVGAGFIAMYATLASRDVDCCLIPESPFYLEGKGGLFEYIEKTIKDNGHMVIVIAEGAGQELLAEKNEQDASGNKLLQDVGLWISNRIRVNFIFILISVAIY